jgi:spore coat polysaccharide biosynthesis protein SpsF
MMKRVIIIQARMTSTRLPGKVLKTVAGQPMLAWQLRRLTQCSAVDEIVVATTTNRSDDPVVDLARREGLGWFRGSEANVLSRFVGAARQAEADIVVRLTADCPLIDPQITDWVIQDLAEHQGECDYASNVLKRTYPRGLDVEAFFMDTLLRIDRLGRSQLAREHVTVFLRSERPDLFLLRSVADTEDNSDLRWTVDSELDLQLIRLLYEELDLGTKVVPYRSMLAYVRQHPEITAINADVSTWTPIQ